MLQEKKMHLPSKATIGKYMYRIDAKMKEQDNLCNTILKNELGREKGLLYILANISIGTRRIFSVWYCICYPYYHIW